MSVVRKLFVSLGMREEKKARSLPFFHAVSHNLKGLAARYGVRVVFRNGLRLSYLEPYSEVNKESGKKHKNPAVDCNKKKKCRL